MHAAGGWAIEVCGASLSTRTRRRLAEPEMEMESSDLSSVAPLQRKLD